MHHPRKYCRKPVRAQLFCYRQKLEFKLKSDFQEPKPPGKEAVNQSESSGEITNGFFSYIKEK
jgi:hypothetical protein